MKVDNFILFYKEQVDSTAVILEQVHTDFLWVSKIKGEASYTSYLTSVPHTQTLLSS